MTRYLPFVLSVWLLCGLAVSPVLAQEDTRPSGTTFLGDTGLWFVPSAETLARGRWSLSAYRANFDREQGFTDITYLAGTAAFGFGRAELFGSFRFDTRIDRDLRPLFQPARSDIGGLANDVPLTSRGWSGDSLGDLLVGAKVNLLSESRQQPLALAVRGIAQLPTGDEEKGAGTGMLDGLFDVVLSKAIQDRAEVAGYFGFRLRSDPDEVELSNGMRWGIGAGFPLRSGLRAFTEVNGEFALDSEVVAATPLVAGDGSRSPLISEIRDPIDVTVGLMWQYESGVFWGGGFNWAANLRPREDFGFENDGGDQFGIQFRLGYHPGAPVYVPPPPPPPPPPPEVQNRPPTVDVTCDPCTVLVGETVRLTAAANDPDGDPLTYRWAAPTGQFLDPPDRETKRWQAPNQPGPVPITVTVTDGRGGSATDSVTIQVNPAPEVEREISFEDVHFDFDRYTLRPAATRALDEVVQAMQEDSTLRLEVEGHTCNIGTTEYNLALGERRATAVRDYLTSRGIAATRLQTVSYGEERPQHDNAREETRRLNRRAALVVRLQ